MGLHSENLIKLSKHEGTGNDFLVLLDLSDSIHLSPNQVQLLCDRHRGIGADGIIRVTKADNSADVTMELHNCDGRIAEMSGNGIRCLAQAVVDAGMVPGLNFTVSTGAGIRSIEYQPLERKGWASATVDMGPVRLGKDQPQKFEGRRVRSVNTGNPHLVLLSRDIGEVDALALGPKIEAVHPGGINVEFISTSSVADVLDLKVWERGVGITLACGTGSVAAAAAARSWGLVGDVVTVNNPGGPLEVRLSAFSGDKIFSDGGGGSDGGGENDGGGDGRNGEVVSFVSWLSGPVHKIGVIELDLSEYA